MPHSASEAARTTPPVPPRRSWRAAGRWFAAEFVVVVAGVLVALTVNAAWSARQDTERERTYLLQLASDLRETERLMRRADSTDVRGDRAAAALLRAYRTGERPPRDSVITWLYLFPTINVPVLVKGTAEALVATGDLGLIRDDSLRMEIAAYVDATRLTEEENRMLLERSLDDFLGLQGHFDRVALMALMVDPAVQDSIARTNVTYPLPEEVVAEPFPLDTERLFADRAAYDDLVSWTFIKMNLRTRRGQIRREAAALRRKVERHLGVVPEEPAGASASGDR